jgi:hypothetical protein
VDCNGNTHREERKSRQNRREQGWKRTNENRSLDHLCSGAGETEHKSAGETLCVVTENEAPGPTSDYGSKKSSKTKIGLAPSLRRQRNSRARVKLGGGNLVRAAVDGDRTLRGQPHDARNSGRSEGPSQMASQLKIMNRREHWAGGNMRRNRGKLCWRRDSRAKTNPFGRKRHG